MSSTSGLGEGGCTITVNDQGNSGTGGAKTSSAFFLVSVSAIPILLPFPTRHMQTFRFATFSLSTKVSLPPGFDGNDRILRLTWSVSPALTGDSVGVQALKTLMQNSNTLTLPIKSRVLAVNTTYTFTLSASYTSQPSVLVSSQSVIVFIAR